MRYNPCGYAVDIQRDGYSVACRFNRDDPTPSRIVWVDCQPGAPVLPFTSLIVSGSLESDRWLPSDVGEVAGARLTFVSRRAPVGIDGNHFCGPVEYFERGGLALPDEPPTRYGADGWPLCCAPPALPRGGAGASGDSPFVARRSWSDRSGAGASGRSPYILDSVDGAEGGAEVGGAVGDRWYGPYAARGGVEVGGASGDVLSGTDGAEGGVEVGGAVGDRWYGPYAARGGVEVGGASGDVLSGTDGAEGGVEVGGASGDVLSGADGAEGGVEIGGASGDVWIPPGAAEGGVEIGGASGDVLSGTDGSEGGVEIGGASGDVLSGTDGSEGGVEVGGEAGDVWTPGGVVPGDICATAGVILMDTTYPANYPSGSFTHWWRIDGVADGDYHLVTTDFPPGTGWDIIVAPDCSGGIPVGGGNTDCLSFPVLIFPNLFLRLTGTVASAGSYSIIVSAGNCP